MTWLLDKLGVKDGVIIILITVIAGIAQQWHSDHVELAKAKLVYDHPQIKYLDRIVYKLGPVRIKTIIIHEPNGETKTQIVEDRGEAITTTEVKTDSAPVALNATLKEPRTDRYLISVGMNRLTPDFDGKAIFIGYGFKNRVDVQVGGVKHDGFSPWVLATARF